MSASEERKTYAMRELFPELAKELEDLFHGKSEPVLAKRVPDLHVVDRCRCGDDFCATFCTQPKPNGAYGPGLRCIDLESDKGMLIIDVVDGAIMSVEALHRDEIRKKLLKVFP